MTKCLHILKIAVCKQGRVVMFICPLCGEVIHVDNSLNHYR